MKRRHRPPAPATYTLLDEMTASPSQPIKNSDRQHQLTRMWVSLRNIETAPSPSVADWRICSDAVNLMETLITTNGGHWPDCDGDLVQVSDTTGLLDDAVKALALAGIRHIKHGHPIRLDAPGIKAVRTILDVYSMMLETLPARTMVRCHRLTERRLREIMAGRRQPHDIEIVDL